MELDHIQDLNHIKMIQIDQDHITHIITIIIRMIPMELDQDHHEMTQTELSHIILTILIILHITKQILLDLLEKKDSSHSDLISQRIKLMDQSHSSHIKTIPIVQSPIIITIGTHIKTTLMDQM